MDACPSPIWLDLSHVAYILFSQGALGELTSGCDDTVVYMGRVWSEG